MADQGRLVQIAMVMVGTLSVLGVIGNSLVLYVFAKQKQKFSSTIFILTLAGTDFVSSLVTMPYTVVVELLEYRLNNDIACRIYYFVLSTPIIFSVFMMAAIAVDRYVSVVHPFKHIMTFRRAKVIVGLLTFLAIIIGIVMCLQYGVKSSIVITCRLKSSSTLAGLPHNTTLMLRNVSSANLCNDTDTDGDFTRMEHTRLCRRTHIIFDYLFWKVYRIIYSSLYIVCAVIVIVLYAITYCSVLSHRRKRLHVPYRCCGFCMQIDKAEKTNVEQRELTFQLGNKVNNYNDNRPKTKEMTPAQGNKIELCNRTTTGKGTKYIKTQAQLSDASRAKMEKLRLANIKTAFMLSIVALIFILAYMPAWLMAYSILPMNVIIFYFYFTYNVANPVIYAFFNRNFRNHLQTLIKCKN